MNVELFLESWGLNSLNLLSLIWLLVCWLGYSQFAKRKAKTAMCLASVMHDHRVDWMHELLFRENRVSDASVIANLERNVAFMASTTILVLAGVLTALANADDLAGELSRVPYFAHITVQQMQLKLLVLSVVFVYAFFTFTWSLRQFGFSGVLLCAMPIIKEGDMSEDQHHTYALHCGKVMDQAAHSYNYGLRAYYFSLAMLMWFVHPVLFMLTVAAVVAVLHHREFRSKTLRLLQQVNEDWDRFSVQQKKRLNKAD